MKEQIQNLLSHVEQITSHKDYKFAENVTVMAATKTQNMQDILRARDFGISAFGENRMQEWRDKKDGEIKFDFIGSLQANKLKYLVGEVGTIQSVSSEKLILETDKVAKKKSVVQNILLEVNIGEEDQKSGIQKSDVARLSALCLTLENIKLKGYMTVLPILSKQSDESLYLQMREIYEEERGKNPEIDTLSMGMSDDYEIAIKNGSNMIRVGTLIFGKR